MKYFAMFLTGLFMIAQDGRLDIDGSGNPHPIARGGSIVINGTLGSGSGDWPSTTGSQTGRLNRNGVASSCASPKVCDIFLTDPGRQFDAYEFANNSGGTECVNVTLDVLTTDGANYQVNAYLNSYDPTDICVGYVADPGLSSGSSPPSATSMSFEVPDGDTLILVVHTTNPGETGGDYTLTVDGNIGDTVPPIPTMGEWGLIAFLSLLAVSALVMMRRTRKA